MQKSLNTAAWLQVEPSVTAPLGHEYGWTSCSCNRSSQVVLFRVNHVMMTYSIIGSVHSFISYRIATFMRHLQKRRDSTLNAVNI